MPSKRVLTILGLNCISNLKIRRRKIITAKKVVERIRTAVKHAAASKARAKRAELIIIAKYANLRPFGRLCDCLRAMDRKRQNSPFHKR